MENDFHVFKRCGKAVIDNGYLCELEVGVPTGIFQVPFFQGSCVVIGEAVDADDLMPVYQESLAEMRTDEPGSSGNGDLRGATKHVYRA
jgi:hypothetical protein